MDKTPNRECNTEGNNKSEKSFHNSYFYQYSINKKNSYSKPFNRGRTASSTDKKNSFLPMINRGLELLTKKKKGKIILNFQNGGNLYDKVNFDDQNDRDFLLIQIYNSQNDIKKKNNEIKNLKEMFEIIENLYHFDHQN